MQHFPGKGKNEGKDEREEGDAQLRQGEKCICILMGSIFNLIQIKLQTHYFLKERNCSNNQSRLCGRTAAHIQTRDWLGTGTT